jgi:hypothetical protein
LHEPPHPTAAPAAIAPGIRKENGHDTQALTMTYSPTAAATIAPAAAGTKNVGQAKKLRRSGRRIMVKIKSPISR